MNTINISKKKFETLNKLILDNKIFNTEGIIYNFNYNGKEKIFKNLYNITGVSFANKLYTIEMLNFYKDYLPKHLCCPDNLVSVNGKVIGFTMPKLDGINLRVLLDNKDVAIKEKIYYLSKIGEILNQMKKIREYTPLNSFYINDLHEANIIVNPSNKDLDIVDLDSCKISRNGCFPSRFLGPNEFISERPNKYTYNNDINNGTGYLVANENSDLFCYNVMILNFLYNGRVDKMNIQEFYNYLNYLNKLGFNKKLLDSFNKLAINCDNENPYCLLETLEEQQIYRANEKVYKLVTSKQKK